AEHILELSSDQEAPNVAIDAILRLGRDEYGRDRTRKAAKSARAALARTPSRRRIAFWHASDRLAGHAILVQPLESVWQMELLGFSPSLVLDDIDWLLEDAQSRLNPRERVLAINAAMEIWRGNDSASQLLTRIEAIANTDKAMRAAVDGWLKPPTMSPE